MTMNYPQRSGRAKSDKQEVTNRDINASQRAVMAVQLRAQMLTYAEIAKRTGYSGPSACRKAILREMDRTVVKNVEELRAQELSMLNIMHSKCWAKFIDETNPWAFSEVERILKISERRCRLMGMDVMPEQAANQNVVLIREIPQGLLDVVEQVQ